MSLLQKNADRLIETNRDHEVVETVGDRGMSELDLEILLNVWDRITAGQDFCLRSDNTETVTWDNLNRSVNY